jgi:hypothetical protein
MLFMSYWRRYWCFLPFLFRCFGAGLEAIAVIAGLQNVAAMAEAIEQGRSHFRVTEHGGPVAEAQVGGDDDAGALVIASFLTGCVRKTYAAIFSFMAGVMPPMPMFGRSLSYVQSNVWPDPVPPRCFR